MYKAYFRLSMELIRDVVRALEEEMVANFDEESDKPVSASFNCPIPHGERCCTNSHIPFLLGR